MLILAITSIFMSHDPSKNEFLFELFKLGYFHIKTIELMAFALLIGFIFSTNSFDLLVNESNCVYDHVYSDTFTSNSVICLIRCTFKSIKTKSKGGAIIISLRNNFGMQNLIDNCIFSQCYSMEGGAIYIDMDKRADTKIINSIFTENYAVYTSGGIFINSKYRLNGNLQVQNCIIKSNTGHKKGGFICLYNLNSTFDNCTFSDNKLYSNTDNSKGGSVYCEKSQSFFLNCSFTNNLADSSDNSYGGSIYLIQIQLNGSFIECTFKNNTSATDRYYSIGGAISNEIGAFETYIDSFEMNESIIKCYFYNNTCISKYSKSFGGSISSIIHLDYSIVKINTTISDVTFVNNSVISFKYSFGGAFFYGYKQVDYKINTQKITAINIFKNVKFNNNKAISNLSSNGGAVSNCPYLKLKFLKYPETHFINSSFINNTAYSSSIEVNLLSLGGAIHLNMSNGFIKNCTFNKNVAETYLSSFLIKGKEPQTLGGSVYINHTYHSLFNISDCLFLNNCGIGKSLKYFSTGKGGALFCSDIDISIYKCNFINNTQIHYGCKFDIQCSIEGGAFYSKYEYPEFVDCVFENNTVILKESEGSNHLLAKVKGGAIMTEIKLLSNCKFKKNSVMIPNQKEKEFGGAIYVNAGNITRCTFDNNVAYNGCDISLQQYLFKSLQLKLTINECIFNHDIEKNEKIYSLFHFSMINNNTLIYDFINNKVFTNMHTFVFDGEKRRVFVIMKSNFENNCISPYNKEKFKSDGIYFYDSKMNQISFEASFKSNCVIESKSNPNPIMTLTQPFKTTTLILNNITNNSFKRKINKIFNLLICILVFQVIITILIIGMVILVLLKKNNNLEDLTHLIEDPY